MAQMLGPGKQWVRGLTVSVYQVPSLRRPLYALLVRDSTTEINMQVIPSHQEPHLRM